MKRTVLLYGASGFSGRLIAAEAMLNGMGRSGANQFRMILAGRDAAALASVGAANDMDVRVFALTDGAAVRSGLTGVDVVLNAAGPFADTAKTVLDAAIAAGCGYVDISGEVDVYQTLRGRAQASDAKAIAIVSGAGASGGVAAVMTDLALGAIAASPGASNEFSAIRVAHSREFFVSRGSVATVLRALTHQVLVVRSSSAAANGCACCPTDPVSGAMAPAYAPVGALERAFDFGALPLDEGGRRIGSGLSVVDTLSAWDCVVKRSATAKTIESYDVLGALGRVGYQVVANAPLFFGLPGVRKAAEIGVSFLPEGPTAAEMDKERHATVLEVDDASGAHLVNWRLETPNVYRLTAQLAVAAAVGADRLQRTHPGDLGWTTAAEALGLGLATFGTGALDGCTLDRRLG